MHHADRDAALADVDGANPKHVLELLEWRGDLLSAVRVFHA